MTCRTDTTGAAAQAMDSIYSEATAVAHMLHLLVDDLERMFDTGRAAKSDGETVTFHFSEAGIDGTLWLVSEAWNRAFELRKAVVAQQHRLDALAQEVAQ